MTTTPRAFAVPFALLLLALLPTWSGAAPQRILSINLCADWLITHHVEPQRVIALSPLKQRFHLPFLAAYPRGSHDGRLESIVALKPDLIFSGEYDSPLLQKRLRQLGLRVEILPLPRRLNEVENYERLFLQLAGLDPQRATPMPTSSAATDATAESANTAHDLPPRLLLLGANGIATGRGTLEDDILQRAGWQNAVQENGHVSIDLEQLIANPPAALLWAAPSDSPALANQLAKSGIWSKTSRRLHSEFWRWQCPGPWTKDIVHELHHQRQSMTMPRSNN